MFDKNIYIWNIEAIFGGDTERIAAELKAAGFTSAILHESNLARWITNKRVELVQDLKAVGITPIGGAAVYGYDPIKEGIQAAEICNDYGLSCFVFDAESTWDSQPKADSNAVNLIVTFRQNAPGVKVGWCWWARYKSPISGSQWHPKSVLWAAMAPGYGDADFGLPMAYWWDSAPENALLLLEQTFSQWREVTDKPLVPIGRAYIGDGGTPTPEACTAFYNESVEYGVDGVSWWSMQHAVSLPDIWNALTAIQRQNNGGVEPEPPPEEEPEMTWVNNALGLYTHDLVSPLDLEEYDYLIAKIGDDFTDDFTKNVQSAADAGIPCILFADHQILKWHVDLTFDPDDWDREIENEPLIKKLDRYIYSAEVARDIHGIMLNCQYVTDEHGTPLTYNWWSERSRWMLNLIKERYGLKVYLYMNKDPINTYNTGDEKEKVYELCKDFGISVVDFVPTIDGYPDTIDSETHPWRPFIGEDYAWYFWLYRWNPGVFLYNGTPEELYKALGYEEYPPYPQDPDPEPEPEPVDPLITFINELAQRIQALEDWKNKSL